MSSTTPVGKKTFNVLDKNKYRNFLDKNKYRNFLDKNKYSILFYGLGIISLVVMLVLYFTIFKDENPKTPSNNQFQYNPILNNKDNPAPVPNDVLDVACGLGTVNSDGMCVPDTELLVSSLDTGGYITVDYRDEPVYDPILDFEEIEPIPVWFEPWIDRGAFSCNTTIGEGLTNPGCGIRVSCSCGDCAGWRGGNRTDCDKKTIDTGGRVICETEEFPDLCKCAPGYCPVNGICVSPYVPTSASNLNNDVCCPSCIVFSAF